MCRLHCTLFNFNRVTITLNQLLIIGEWRREIDRKGKEGRESVAHRYMTTFSPSPPFSTPSPPLPPSPPSRLYSCNRQVRVIGSLRPSIHSNLSVLATTPVSDACAFSLLGLYLCAYFWECPALRIFPRCKIDPTVYKAIQNVHNAIVCLL